MIVDRNQQKEKALKKLARVSCKMAGEKGWTTTCDVLYEFYDQQVREKEQMKFNKEAMFIDLRLVIKTKSQMKKAFKRYHDLI